MPCMMSSEESCCSQDITATESDLVTTGKSLKGVKRDISGMDDAEDDASPIKKMKASPGLRSIHATTTIMNPQARSEECDSTIASLKSSLRNANEELERWKQAFIDNSILPSGTTPDPAAVVQVIQKLQASEVQLQEQVLILQLLTARRREGALLVKLGNTEHEILGLKSTVRSLKRQSKWPLSSVARSLLPKPANFDEVSRLKKELKPAEKITMEVPDITASIYIRPQNMRSNVLNAEFPADLTENSGAACEVLEDKEDDGLQLMYVPFPSTKKKLGSSRKYLIAKEEAEGEEAKKNWMDSEVETLISLRWELEPDFLKNAYKQGVDMWSQLQARMSSAIPGFTRSGLACQRKFNSLIKQHKKDVLDVKEGKHHTWDRHARKFYDSLDRCWHTNGTVMKHVTANSMHVNHSDSDTALTNGNKEENLRMSVKEDEGEEAKKNWLDSEAETMVSLRWEMEPEFVGNAYKTGEDMWSKLQMRMVSLIPGFQRSGLACQRKFNALIKQHKKDILELKESGRERYNYRFYDILDRWWHTNGTVMKHVTASPNDSESLGNPEHLTEYLDDASNKLLREGDEGEEGKKNWADSEVETLIGLRKEMDSEFVKNWKKQGGNMWSKLRSRMLSLYPGFTRSPLACKRKFNTLVRHHKKYMHILAASGEEPLNFKHHDLLVQWLHNNRTSLRCSTATASASASASDSDLNQLTTGDPTVASESQRDVCKPNKAESSIIPYVVGIQYGINVPGSLSNVIEPSSDVNEKDKPSMLLAKLDGEIDPFMDSLKPTVSI
ncbi:uncharacterized protein [Physcomitrium patens]|uniref:uncharacterized protein isoform X3 n=1 Tax=Physcomitrium patens TaxID=3218 RepID=UPI000D168DD2|nr:uncharacterized protein LOC112285575 isoform X3 [Physcomitrium patens]|eukprot:XP_024382268.1 uncharacterized protein LOC112285575 isoform X3 [Physcomitrella patens]